jgi:single-stranded-DNA-specific exonuclease
MKDTRSNWQFPGPDTAIVSDMAAALDISQHIARALVNRGIQSMDAARAFLLPSEASLHDPFLMTDMRRAVDRATAALQNKERILVLGDYDVDGISGTALLVSFLRRLGGNVNYYIPDRETEGYGLSEDVVRKSRKAGYNLIITVDSGVSATHEADVARTLGLDMIIIDHHEPPQALPRAAALLNPKREDCSYPFRDLAGVGVAFKFCCALGQTRGIGIRDMMDGYAELVALGTVADLVTLVDENRALVRTGLEHMANTGNLGLRYLIDVSRYNEEDRPDTFLVSFGLAPRINAAGRVWKPRAGVELLLADAPDRADKIARKLDFHNRARIREEALILETAQDMLRGSGILEKDKAILLFHEDWNIGIVGIVASKLLERHYRPVILMTVSGRPDDKSNPHPEKGRVCQGSARSIREVDIHALLTQCEDLLITYGGHAMAAGIKIYERDIPALRARFNEILNGLTPRGRYSPSLAIDGVLRLDEITMDFLKQTQLMEPCGAGNSKPLFAATNLNVLETRPCGADGRHLLMRLGQNNAIADAIGFNLAHRFNPAEFHGAAIDAAFNLKEDNFRGKRSVKLNLMDIRLSQS